MAGWDAGPEAPKGWTIKGGELSGYKGCTPLTSAWTFGDFELEVGFKGKSLADLSIQLIDAATGKSVYQTLFRATSDESMKIRREGKNIIDGETKVDKRSRTAIPIDGEVKGDKRSRLEIPLLKSDQRVALRISVVDGTGTITRLRLKEPDGESIFNPIDITLTGWHAPVHPEAWTVEDGKIVCLNKQGEYLQTEKQYGNFTLSLEYNIAQGGNSGIGIRTPPGGWPSGDGMEMQVEDRPRDEPLNGQSPMAIYSNVEPFARADVSKQWNRVVVKAEGYMISAWMNGELVQNVNTYWQPELKLRHLKGWIGLQDHNDHVEYRNIRVLEAPDGLGLDEWYAPHKPFGSQLIAERLMNPDVLASGDGLTLRTHQAEIFSEHMQETIAVLTGPGAVLNIARSNEKGRVRMYFDDEVKPSVDCDAADLLDHLPGWSRDADPMLVYVPYAKSLKITLSGAKADYRVDYVTFDEDVQIEPFAGPSHTALRGLQTAVAYRLHQMNHGMIRKEDLSQKTTSKPTTIEPGKTVTLVKLDGAGVVEWFKLKCSSKLLTNDDLWIEVTVDGETSPAIAAPVRYFFPGMGTGKGYRNFVVTSKLGYTNRLAMPYAKNFSIALQNRSKRAIKDLELSTSYRSLTEPSKVKPSPLRGRFFAGDSVSQATPIMRSGERLVGCVVSPTEGADGTLWQWLELPQKPAEIRQALNGRSNGLAWRWWLLGSPKASDVKEPNLPVGSVNGVLMLYYNASAQ